MVEVQDILNLYGESLRKEYVGKISPSQHRVIEHLTMCRTAALWGHIDKCDHCEHERISYNSCRDRHCPKCQFLKKEKWLENRLADFLPINYFHVVFTLPSELHPLMLNNQKILYDLFFRCVSQTLRDISLDPKHLGGKSGFIAVLHTWGQNLSYHPHIHCIVTGGGLSENKKQWITSRSKFLFSVKVLGSLFKGKFLDGKKNEFLKNSLEMDFTEKNFKKLLDSLYE